MTDDPPAVPVSTYRLQVTADWPLSAAADLVPYLADLGADWVYLSPILAAEAGSGHGYDVVDHAEVDPDRGGDIGLRRVADAAHAAGRGVLVDIVPNHVGVATPAASVWWWDVLTHGRNSRYGEYFDVEWQASGGRIRLPILGDGEDELAALRIENDELCYYDHRLPIAPRSGWNCPRCSPPRTPRSGGGSTEAGWTACASTIRTGWPTPAGIWTTWPSSPVAGTCWSRRSWRGMRPCRRPGPVRAPPGTTRWPRSTGCSSTPTASTRWTCWTPSCAVGWPSTGRR